MSRHMFKLLVVVNQILLFASMLVAEITDTTPNVDESVFVSENSSWPPFSDVPYWLGWILVATGLGAAVGLCLEQGWGRTLFVATFVVAVISTPLTEFYVSPGWASVFGYLASATEGMIIALAYFSPVRRMYEPSEPDSQT